MRKITFLCLLLAGSFTTLAQSSRHIMYISEASSLDLYQTQINFGAREGVEYANEIRIEGDTLFFIYDLVDDQSVTQAGSTEAFTHSLINQTTGSVYAQEYVGFILENEATGQTVDRKKKKKGEPTVLYSSEVASITYIPIGFANMDVNGDYDVYWQTKIFSMDSLVFGGFEFDGNTRIAMYELVLSQNSSLTNTNPVSTLSFTPNFGEDGLEVEVRKGGKKKGQTVVLYSQGVAEEVFTPSSMLCSENGGLVSGNFVVDHLANQKVTFLTTEWDTDSSRVLVYEVTSDPGALAGTTPLNFSFTLNNNESEFSVQTKKGGKKKGEATVLYSSSATFINPYTPLGFAAAASGNNLSGSFVVDHLAGEKISNVLYEYDGNTLVLVYDVVPAQSQNTATVVNYSFDRQFFENGFQIQIRKGGKKKGQATVLYSS